MTTTDPIAEQLAHWRDDYTNRRTVSWEMLHEAERLVRASVAYHERQARATVAEVEERLAVLEDQHARELERAAERETRALERAERAERSEREYRQRQTNTRETRETIEDGTVVRITAPRTQGSTYAKDGHPRPWTLGELDQLLIRFRLAGGMDDTEVRFKHEHAEVCVPFPELALPERDDYEYDSRDVQPRRPDGVARRVHVNWQLAPAALIAMVVVMAVAAVIR